MFKKLIVILVGAIVMLTAASGAVFSILNPYPMSAVFVLQNLLVIFFTYFGVKYLLSTYCNDKPHAKNR